MGCGMATAVKPTLSMRPEVDRMLVDYIEHAPGAAIRHPLTLRSAQVALIDLSRTRSLDPAAVAGEAGRLTPDTTRLLDLAVRTYFGVRA